MDFGAHLPLMDLMTTVALPIVRGPVPLAKTLGASLNCLRSVSCRSLPSRLASRERGRS